MFLNNTFIPNDMNVAAELNLLERGASQQEVSLARKCLSNTNTHTHDFYACNTLIPSEQRAFLKDADGFLKLQLLMYNYYIIFLFNFFSQQCSTILFSLELNRSLPAVTK